MGPDRRDFHCILLDRCGIDIEAGCRCFNRSLVSVRDFVRVYDVKPTPQAFESPEDTLKKASIPRMTALETTASFFFRAAHYALVTITNRSDPVYGIILSLTTRNNRVTHARAVFEGSPDAVTVTPALCNFNLKRLHQYDIVGAHSRVNVSSAMRFCEPPVSLEAREHPAATVRRLFSMHPEEGILPTRVFLLPLNDREWCADRLQRFDNFHRDPAGSKRKAGRIPNAACAALAAINAAGDGRRTHLREVTLVYPLWHPIRIQFSLTDMASGDGWAPGRHVVL
ncbi:hypothetical protein V3C99_015137 [Haemonchus contortus]